MSRHCLAWSQVPETVNDKGVRRREMPGTGVALVRLTIPAGTKAPRHSHPHEQFVQVIEGSGFLETDQGRVPFAAGSVFHFPAEVGHSAEFETETVLVETNPSA